MRHPSHNDPSNHVDHPLDFSAKHAWDLYLNPWWGFRFLNGNVELITDSLTEILGWPQMQWQGCFNELVWGNRETPPRFSVNLSGGNGSIWFHLDLPWARISTKDLQNRDVAYRSENENPGGVPLDVHLRNINNYAGIERLSAKDSSYLEKIASHYSVSWMGCPTVGALINRLPSSARNIKIDPETPELEEILARYKNVPALTFPHPSRFRIFFPKF